MNKKQKKIFVRIIIAFVLFVVGLAIKKFCGSGYWYILPYIVSYAVIGYDVVYNAVRGIINKSLLDENLLMCIASLGSFALKEYTESVFIILLYQIGELFSSYAVQKSRKNIKELTAMRPDKAVVIRNGTECETEPENVEIGEIISVLPGEKIPIDGVVVKGESFVDTSAITGESVRKRISEGDNALSGYINCNSVIKIKTVCKYENSTVAKILELVENCADSKSKSETFITKFTRYYTPAVVIAALITALIVPIFIGDFTVWLKRALSFLVISCPCALVISVPLAYFCGIGTASKKGILIKGSAYIDTVSESKTVVFDKTGTLTEGNFCVREVKSVLYGEEEFLKIVAAAEAHSNHPIAHSILEYTNGFEISAENITETAGKGVSAVVNGKTVLAGNSKLMEENSVKYIKTSAAYTTVHIAVDGIYAGYILLSDIPKENSAKAVQKLKALDIKSTVMLTGDKKETAEEIKNVLGIDKAVSELLPEGKVNWFKEIKKCEKSPVMYVGDGINDAPVLTLADVSVAMGNRGSDAAVEAADIVIIDDDLLKIAECLKISRKTENTVKENIYISLTIKAVVFVLTLLGLSNMMMAMFADVGVSVIAILNSMRMLLKKKQI